MDNFEIILDKTDDIAFKTPIRKGVKDYNIPYLGAWETKPFTFYIKDTQGIVIAGTYGRYIEDELVEIDYLWVDEKHRGQKLGADIMKSVEDFARKCNAGRINLYTMDFQALDFYKKQGFTMLAAVPKWARSYDAYFMRKVL